MASLLRRFAGPATRKLFTLPRHLAASSPAATRSYSGYDFPRDDTTLYGPHNPPVHWGVTIVPERQTFVVERFGKYLRTLGSGFHLLIPIIDRITYVHCLKEQAFSIRNQEVVTKDKITMHMDGAIYIKIIDPYLASYGVKNPIHAVLQLSEFIAGNEFGKITLSKTFEQSDTLSEKIVIAINKAVAHWGLKCLRYEITNITPPEESMMAMGMQAEAERKGCGHILEAEGNKSSQVPEAEGKKSDQILES